MNNHLKQWHHYWQCLFEITREVSVDWSKLFEILLIFDTKWIIILSSTSSFLSKSGFMSDSEYLKHWCHCWQCLSEITRCHFILIEMIVRNFVDLIQSSMIVLSSWTSLLSKIEFISESEYLKHWYPCYHDLFEMTRGQCRLIEIVRNFWHFWILIFISMIVLSSMSSLLFKIEFMLDSEYLKRWYNCWESLFEMTRGQYWNSWLIQNYLNRFKYRLSLN